MDSDDEDEYIDQSKGMSGSKNPVKKARDPADIIEINARLFQVKEFYIDKIIANIKEASNRGKIKLSQEDKDLIHEAFESFH